MIAFNEKYDKNTFSTFLSDFLPEDYKENEKDIAQLDSCQVIKSAREIGFCESLDVTVLEMSHSKNTDPRVTVATDAFKILKSYDIQKALVIFKNDESENYRFSYLTITLDIDGKSKIKKSYSNARRYSFYLGKGAKTKTPEQQLIKKGKVTDKKDLFSRFSVEVVNKQFYLEVAKYFDDLVAEDTNFLTLPFQTDQNVRKSFAVRLIGRLMFCWFLKQKRSPNGQLVPDEILSSNAVGNNYYHEVLERLFFEVLNTAIDDREIRNDLFDKVPYLNGGLFNPQHDDYYELDREIFVSRHINTLKIDDSWFKHFFELLETYNFTIDENTAFDQELSVDPEMLGRIFENLLAEINPETGTSERKRTGSFYTPRQIVEYMVDQSLIEYLNKETLIDHKKLETLVSYDLGDDIDYPLTDVDKQKVIDALDTLKVLDPACGSGAYPIGVLQKVVYILQTVDSSGSLWRNKKLKNIPELYRTKIENELGSQTLDYIRKLEIIKNSIFGVDIQPIAVEVSRLRCFLTLVVESDIVDTRKNRGIQALPNLDFKFVCANTLMQAPEQSSDETDKLFGDDFQEKLTIAVDKYFSSSGETKRSANNEIHKLIDAKVDEKLKHLQSLVSYNGDRKMEAILASTRKDDIREHTRILTLWSSYKNVFENKPVGFFDHKYFFPSVKDGFDVVIANPPYGLINKKQNKHTSITIDEFDFGKLKESYPDATGGMINIFRFFILRSIDLLKEGGVFCEIFPLSFTGDLSMKNLRANIFRNHKIISIEAFPERDNVNKRVFEGVKMSVCIMTLLKKQEQGSFHLRKNSDKFVDTTAKRIALSNGDIKLFDPRGLSIPLIDLEADKILKQVYSTSIRFGDFSHCFDGEVHLTKHKQFITDNPTGATLLKGAIVGRYEIREKMSQGNIQYLDKEEYLASGNGEKSQHHKNKRIVMQRITGVNEGLRIKAMIIDTGIFCAN